MSQERGKFVGLRLTLDSVVLVCYWEFLGEFKLIWSAIPWFSQNISENDDIRFIIRKK